MSCCDGRTAMSGLHQSSARPRRTRALSLPPSSPQLRSTCSTRRKRLETPNDCHCCFAQPLTHRAHALSLHAHIWRSHAEPPERSARARTTSLVCVGACVTLGACAHGTRAVQACGVRGERSVQELAARVGDCLSLWAVTCADAGGRVAHLPRRDRLDRRCARRPDDEQTLRLPVQARDYIHKLCHELPERVRSHRPGTGRGTT